MEPRMLANRRFEKLTRRRLLAGAAALASGLPTALAGSRARAATPVKLTLPWIANGSNYWPVIGKKLGYFSKRGIDVDVARGFGSVAAAQAVANKQFDFGLVFAGGNILAAARGLPIIVLATVVYDAMMGIALRPDSSISTPKDLEGKRLGIVPTSAEAPFWPAFAQAAGIDASKVSLVQVDAKVVERVLFDRQVDAITAIGSSSVPVMVALGERPRFMLWSKFGVELYAGQIVTRPDVLDANPDLCQSMVDAILESYAHTLREPERSIDEFAQEVPEIGLTKGGRENAQISQGLAQLMTVRPEAIDHALGWTDPGKLPAMIDLVMKYGVPADAKRPDPEKLATNKFVGRITLTAAEWDQVKKNTAQYASYLG
jgi:ABC-type nitrate/sulfonate/bicarbonate transport system substrate-binding protein